MLKIIEKAKCCRTDCVLYFYNAFFLYFCSVLFPRLYDIYSAKHDDV